MAAESVPITLSIAERLKSAGTTSIGVRVKGAGVTDQTDYGIWWGNYGSGGAGLGLAIVGRIIETHHGRLEIVPPRAGQHGTVRVLLPIDSGVATAA